MFYDNTIFGLTEIRSTVKDFLVDISNYVYINDEIEFKIKLIINELVSNSFKYAKTCSHVRLLAKLNNTDISIALIDDSQGFDYSEIQGIDISEENYMLRESGRGVYLVGELSDNLRYNRKGNIIAIKVNLV